MEPYPTLYSLQETMIDKSFGRVVRTAFLGKRCSRVQNDGYTVISTYIGTPTYTENRLSGIEGKLKLKG